MRTPIPAWWPDDGGESPEDWADPDEEEASDDPIEYPHEIVPARPYDPEF